LPPSSLRCCSAQSLLLHLLSPYCSVDPRDLHSFPTRRSSDLALSADLIWRDVQRLARKIPVLVYMGNAAASGGYYVSAPAHHIIDRKSTRLNSSHVKISYAVFCLKKKKIKDKAD